jgi:hypothetical protein
VAAELRRLAVATAVAVAGAIAGAGCGGGDDRPSREEARSCLEQLDLHVTPSERSPNDDDGPFARLDANDVLRGRLRVEAQYYDDEEEAERYEPGQRRSARTEGGAVERHGTLTLLWLFGHGRPLADRTRDCLL